MDLKRRLTKFNLIQFQIPFEQTFEIICVWYVFFLILEYFEPGIISNFINIKILLYSAIFSFFLNMIIKRNHLVENKYYSQKVRLVTTLIIFFTIIFLFYDAKQSSEFSIIKILLLIVIFVLLLRTFNNSKIIPPKTKKPIISRVFTIGLNFLFLIILFISGLLYLNPTGRYSIRINNLNIKKYTSDPVLSDGKETNQFIVFTDPFHINIPLNRTYESATFQFDFLYNSEPTKIELGTKHANGFFYNQLVVNYNNLIENLPPYWSKKQDDDYMIAVKNKDVESQYATLLKLLEDRTKQINELKDILVQNNKNQYELNKINTNTYTANINKIKDEFDVAINQLNVMYDIKNLKKVEPINYNQLVNKITRNEIQVKEILVQNVSLDQYVNYDFAYKNNADATLEEKVRGAHTLMLYKTTEGPGEIFISLTDANIFEGADPITLTLSQGQTEIYKKEYSDNFNESESADRVISFKQANLKKGLYRLKIDTTDDIFFNTISSTFQDYAFEDSFYSSNNLIYQNVNGVIENKPINIFTNSNSINFSTSHPENYQRVLINDTEIIDIDRIHKKIVKDNLQGITKISLEKGDIKIEGDGIFTMSIDSPMLNYKRNIITEITDDSLNYINTFDYLLLDYPQPSISDSEYYRVTKKIDVPLISFENNTANFILDFEDFGIDKKSITIDNIYIIFNKEKITPQYLLNKIIK